MGVVGRLGGFGVPLCAFGVAALGVVVPVLGGVGVPLCALGVAALGMAWVMLMPGGSGAVPVWAGGVELAVPVAAVCCVPLVLLPFGTGPTGLGTRPTGFGKGLAALPPGLGTVPTGAGKGLAFLATSSGTAPTGFGKGLAAFDTGARPPGGSGGAAVSGGGAPGGGGGVSAAGAGVAVAGLALEVAGGPPVALGPTLPHRVGSKPGVAVTSSGISKFTGAATASHPVVVQIQCRPCQ